MTSEPAAWALDARLAQDTVPVGDLPLSRVLLIDDKTYPWLLLVPRRPATSEIADLDAADRAQLMIEIEAASRAMKTITVCDKLNVAALGNVVAQLHVHVIARFRHDAAWPKPVWGAVPPISYDKKDLESVLAPLREKLTLKAP
jgi:diadenosine tetraphosphate (Ap4A) HIT family hydrolase